MVGMREAVATTEEVVVEEDQITMLTLRKMQKHLEKPQQRISNSIMKLRPKDVVEEEAEVEKELTALQIIEIVEAVKLIITRMLLISQRNNTQKR